MGSATLALVVLIADLSLPLGVAGGVPYVAVILVALRSTSPRQTIGFAVVCSIFTIVGFYWSPGGGVLCHLGDRYSRAFTEKKSAEATAI